MGDRAKLVEERIREEVHPAGLDWISALRGPAIRTPVETGAVQCLLFDEQDLVGIRSDLYPGERLMVCRTPLMAQRRAHTREALLESIAAEAARMASPSSLPACPRQHPVRPVLMSCGLRACSRPRAWPRARDMTPHSGDGLHSLACSRLARRQQRHSYPDAHQAR